MPRFIATRRIYHGTALAFAIGHAVPEANVLAHSYLEQGLVEQVEDGRGDMPDIPTDALPDTTPRRRVAQPEPNEQPTTDDGIASRTAGDGPLIAESEAPAAAKTAKTKPAASGATTSTDTDVKKAV